MGRPRTYGARKQHTSAAASAIFGKGARASPQTEKTPIRSALADITESLQNVNLHTDDSEQDRVASCDQVEDQNGENDFDDGDSKREDFANLDRLRGDDESQGNILEVPVDNIHHKHLQPLLHAYEIDTGRTLASYSWGDVLPNDCTIVKIAEASYAEVYRITIPSGETSIIKIMRIDSPHDPAGSKSGTAIKVENIVSEVRIMNALTELPGFVRFKDSHIIRGKSVNAFINAYDEREKKCKGRASQFPHPKDYTAESEFLIIELGDAGEVLEDFPISNIDQVWDIFLGTVMALAKGEMANEFEHRDLHENNICISVSADPPRRKGNSNLKLGFAGARVTLIDYGLSRSKLSNGEVVFFNLEEDPMIFQGTEGHPQFNAYRRMRTNLMTSERTSKPKSWHADSTSCNPERSWSEFAPYSNVIWISYMLGYLKKTFKKSGSASSQPLKVFSDETKELNTRLDPRTKMENGAFSTATDVLWHCVEKGWVSEEQAEDYGADISVLHGT